jgi:tetratricopeptide (TPR) repeat protein
LQTHCTKEAGTYWLCRPEGSDEIQLFCLDDADNRQRSALSQPVGLLCFKIARRLQMQDREACAAGGSCKHRQRTARLFCNAISVVDERLHPNVVALSHEGLADAMVGAEWAVPHAHAPQQDMFHGATSASEPEREAEFYVDENGDLQEAKPPAGDFEDDDTARPTVGDTAQWGMSYSLADLENAESHYIEAAAVRGLAMTADEATTRPCSPLEWQFGKGGGKGDEEDSRRESLALVSRRLRCKAAKCAIAISIRLLRKGAVADALIKAVNAFERCVSGQSRAEQEVVSEAMEVWADVHVALAALTRDQVLKVRSDVHDIQEQERFLSSGEFGMCDEPMRGTQQPQHPTPLSHPLSADVEDNCNHAIRCLIRSLHVCNASCRRADLTNKLASVYSQLGAHYITMGRFTRAHQHYQQGTQLFQSIGDDQSAAALTFNLGRLFAARAHAAPMSPGLTPEQLADLLKARSHVLQAHQVLEALVRTLPPHCRARAHKALKDLVAQVQEELADIDMALSVGKLHAVSGANGGSVGWAGKAGSCVVIGGARAGGGGGLGAEEDVGVEEESADRGLQRALSTYECLALPQAAAAHVHLALFMSRVEGEAALLAGGGVGSSGACAGSRVALSSEDKAATQRAIKTWRQRSERHLEQAAALARTLGEKVRVQCIKAEFAAKRGTVGGIEAALQSLLHLPLHPHKPRPVVSSSHPHASESGAGCATAAHFGEASAGLAAATAGSFARWAPFDGGWGANAQQVGAHAGASASACHADGTCDEDLIWLGAQKQTMDLLMLLIRLHSARKGAAQHADRCKALFRSALSLSQQHSGKRFLQLLAEQHANDADGPAVSSRTGMEEDA